MGAPRGYFEVVPDLVVEVLSPTEAGTLTAEPVLPGFSVPVSDLFA
jgi:Uma2 family endonuclease